MILSCIAVLILLHICDRDGVSEGQFSQVLFYEMDAIRRVYFLLMLLKCLQ